jgi:hypothetical protein
VDESAAKNNGYRVSSGGTFMWLDVVDRFIREFHGLGPIPNEEVASVRQRFDLYLQLFIEQNGYRFHKSQEELEKVGEFIAVAVVCGLEEALVYNPERANLVYDILPREWVVSAGFPPESFDAHYFKRTGRKRTHPS